MQSAATGSSNPNLPPAPVRLDAGGTLVNCVTWEAVPEQSLKVRRTTAFYTTRYICLYKKIPECYMAHAICYITSKPRIHNTEILLCYIFSSLVMRQKVRSIAHKSEGNFYISIKFQVNVARSR